jgi:hypothetical protein
MGVAGPFEQVFPAIQFDHVHNHRPLDGEHCVFLSHPYSPAS